MKKVLIIVIVIVIVAAGAWGIRKYLRSQTAVPVAAPTTSVNSDKQQIQTVLEQQVPQRGGVAKFQIIDLKFSGDYARATLKPIDVVTDNATVYLQKKNGVWTIVAGPGTGFNPNDPEMKGIPQQLLY